MNNYIEIFKFFNENEDRNIDSISRIYLNKNNFLKNAILNITEKHLTESHIKNKKILINPNWVKHSEKRNDDICLRTNENLLLVVIEIILEKCPSEIIIGDAPIQRCNWDEMIKPGFTKSIDRLSKIFNIPIKIQDFRRVTFNPKLNHLETDRKSLKEYIIFDLGEKSKLESVSSSSKNNFRVNSYNPDSFIESHKLGMHKYCITKTLFDSDIIISIPKIKTHQKTGITGALKNIVGLNGDKDFLPHHRIGGTKSGGDCYPGGNIFRHLSELSLDNANRNKGKFKYWCWLSFSQLLWKLSFPSSVHRLDAGWYGNDTTWRMVSDLNKIVLYGKPDGTFAKAPQRTIFSLSDGIIAGQGNGPLQPDPLPLGIIAFSNNSILNDLCMASLMKLNISKIPLLQENSEILKNYENRIILNNDLISFEDLKKYSIDTELPIGWKNY